MLNQSGDYAPSDNGAGQRVYRTVWPHR